jgi:hypothetical protein
MVEANTAIQSKWQHANERIIMELPYKGAEHPFSLFPGSLNICKTADEKLDG